MGMGSHVRIQTKGHTGYFAPCGRQFVDDLQLRDALHVEAEDIVVEAEVDLPVGLAHTCIDNLRRGESRLDGSLYLSTADTVGTQSCLTDDAEDTRVGVCLDGVVHHESLVFLCLGVDAAQCLAQQFRIVVVEGRLDLLQLLYRELSFSHDCVVSFILTSQFSPLTSYKRWYC